MKLDADLGGTLGAPQIEGTATLVGGTFTDPLKGIRLSGIEGQVTGRGDTLMIERFTAATRNGGTLSAVGRITLDPPAGFPAQIRLRANQAELLASEIVAAVANLDLSVEGPIMQQPRVAGRVDLVSMDVSLPDRLPSHNPATRGDADNRPRRRRCGRLTAEQKAEAQARRGRVSAPSPPSTQHLTMVAAPNRIFVRGRGVDAELGGDLLLQRARKPRSQSAPSTCGVAGFYHRCRPAPRSCGRLKFHRRPRAGARSHCPDPSCNVTAQVEASGPATQPCSRSTPPTSSSAGRSALVLLICEALRQPFRLSGSSARPGSGTTLR